MKHRIDQRLRLATADRERGAGTLEYVGIVVLAAILVAALLLALANFQYRERVEQALCEITSLGQGDCGSVPTADERTPEDYVPPEPCVVLANGAGWDASIAAVVQLEGGQTWLYETLNDGRVRLTRGDSAGVGVGVGAGFDVTLTLDDEVYGGALSAGAAAVLTADEGDVFYAADEAEARAILSAQRTDDVKSATLGDDNWLRSGWDWATEQLGGSTRYEDLEPDETFTRDGIRAEGDAGVTAFYASAGVEGQLGIYEGTINRADKTSTDIFSTDVSVSADAGTWLTRLDNPMGSDGYGVATASAAAGATIEVDRDADGNPVAMRLISLVMADADTYSKTDGDAPPPQFTETTVQIPLETDADLLTGARVAQVLGLEIDGVTDHVSGLDLPGNIIGIQQNADDYAALARDRGYVYEQTYSLDESPYGANFDAKALLEVGLGATYTTIERQAINYRYWDGQEMVTRSECIF